jgi:hypothetical protein
MGPDIPRQRFTAVVLDAEWDVGRASVMFEARWCLLRSVGRSVRLGRWGVCPECRQGVERICRAITKQVQRSDARIEVDVMHTWNECTE